MELEIVTDEDENRKITAIEALKKLDEVKYFIEVKGSNHLNIIFNELFENVEQMKLKNKKHKMTLEVPLDFKIYVIYTVYSYRVKKKSLILISVVFFMLKNPKTPYSEHLVVADTFLGTAGVRYRQV